MHRDEEEKQKSHYVGVNKSAADKFISLEQKTREMKALRYSTYVIFISACLISTIQIWGYLTDNSVRKYSCPANSPYLDAPVKLEKINSISDPKEFQNLLLGFLRKFVKAQYPKREQDVDNYYSYIMANSEGSVLEDYKSRMYDIKKIKANLSKGIYTSLYPKTHFNFKVRKKSKNAWIVQFPAVEVKRISDSDFGRSYVTARYTIEMDGPSLDNSDVSLKVIAYEYIETTDSITGKTRKVR